MRRTVTPGREIRRDPARTLVAGADIGGTFTDICLLEPKTGRSVTRKVLTTHRDPGKAVLAGLAGALGEEGVGSDRVAIVVHATTLATNALIERTGARTGMLTTRGFRDVIEVGYEQLYDLYDIHLDLPPPLVPRTLRRPVAEFGGDVTLPQIRRLHDVHIRVHNLETVLSHSRVPSLEVLAMMVSEAGGERLRRYAAVIT